MATTYRCIHIHNIVHKRVGSWARAIFVDDREPRCEAIKLDPIQQSVDVEVDFGN